jgi:hypothetical protein
MVRFPATLIALVLAVTVVAADEPTLEEVLSRAATYVAGYQRQLQGIVAEEVYRQNVMGTARGVRGRVIRDYRELRSDLLLVKLGDDDWWLQFRDVFEVDRRPVRDRDQRLYKLFVSAKADAKAQATTIQDESSRYNLGPIVRTINIPIMALLFFERAVQPTIKFEKGEAGNVKRLADLAAPESIWMIEYKESGTGTMVKGANNRDIPSHGRVWIDSTNGRILRTELISEDTEIRAAIDVTYKAEKGFDLLVPEEMREVYNVRVTETRIDGRATYGHYRKFSVTTDEKTEKPKP